MQTQKEMIFTQKPTANCHASTVLPLENGEVLAAWFGGTKEGAADVDIWLARRSQNRWGTPFCITADANTAHWNPVLNRLPDGRIALFFKVGLDVPRWKTWVCYSADAGHRWTQPEPLVPGSRIDGRGPVKNKCIPLSDGRLLAPASSEKNRIWRCFTDYSFDNAATWTRSRYVPSVSKKQAFVGAIQPTLWESAPGRVHMLVRTNAGRIYRSDSANFGESWGLLYPTDLPNNNSGIDLVKTDDGTLYLLMNPVAKNWGDRTPLSLLRSRDNAGSWTEILQLETDPGEYSYPAITQQNGILHATYTHCRNYIAYWKIDVNA